VPGKSQIQSFSTIIAAVAEKADMPGKNVKKQDIKERIIHKK